MTSTPAHGNRYLETKVLTAPPEELRLMLLDGAIKFCRQGQEALRRKDFERCHEGYSRCRAILVELVSTMRTEVDPALCQRVAGLYIFLINQLISSSHEKDPARADKVLEILAYERETWALLMVKLAEDRGALGATPVAPVPLAPESAEHTPLSISG